MLVFQNILHKYKNLNPQRQKNHSKILPANALNTFLAKVSISYSQKKTPKTFAAVWSVSHKNDLYKVFKTTHMIENNFKRCFLTGRQIPAIWSLERLYFLKLNIPQKSNINAFRVSFFFWLAFDVNFINPL